MTRTPSARATTAGDPGPPDAAANQVTGASAVARYAFVNSRGGGSRRRLISSQAYDTAATDASAATPEAHTGALAPQASANMPTKASTHAATAVPLTQIRAFTTRSLSGRTARLRDRRVRDSRRRHGGTESVVDVDDRYAGGATV